MSDGRGGGPDRSVGLSRRSLLAAVSTVGTVGALSGIGTAAYLHDRETFGNNEMGAGSLYLDLEAGGTTGSVDLQFDVDDFGYEARDAETLCVGLGEDSNPGWVWLRACPVGVAADDISVRVADASDDTVFSGSLADLLTALSGGDGGGVLLTEFVDAGAVPLDPGTAGAVCLTVELWVPAAFRDDPGTVRRLKALSPLTFAIDVYAEQSRHVPEPRQPAPDGTNPAFAFPECEGPGDFGDPDDPVGHAVSNVWLCVDSPVDPADVSWVVRDPETGADLTGAVTEAYVVEVTSPVPIDYAIVKAGTEFRRFEGDGATTLTVSSTGGTLVDPDQNVANCPCEGEGVKLDDWDEDAGTFTEVEAKSCDGESKAGPADGPKAGEETSPAEPTEPTTVTTTTTNTTTTNTTTTTTTNTTATDPTDGSVGGGAPETGDGDDK